MIKHPKTQNGIVHRNSGSFFRYDGWPSVCRDEEGTLYTVYSGFRADHICPFGKTCLCRSRDNGKTWSFPTVINDTWMDDRDAGICVTDKGTILVTTFTEDGYVDLYQEEADLSVRYKDIPHSPVCKAP